MDYLTNHTSLSPIWHEFASGFVNYKKGCIRLAAANDKVYQLLAHGQWFSSGTPASPTTKTGRHDITEILVKVVLNTKKSINQPTDCVDRSIGEVTLNNSAYGIFCTLLKCSILQVAVSIKMC